jgi:hypothetical protein
MVEGDDPPLAAEPGEVISVRGIIPTQLDAITRAGDPEKVEISLTEYLVGDAVVAEGRVPSLRNPLPARHGYKCCRGEARLLQEILEDMESGWIGDGTYCRRELLRRPVATKPSR